MGVKGLFKVIQERSPDAVKQTKLEDLSGKTVGIDASLSLYQFIIAIKNSGDLKDDKGNSTSHIQAVIGKVLSLLKHNILPVFVFDGKPPSLKNATMEARSKIKKTARDQLASTLDEEEKKRLEKRSVSLTQENINEVKEVLSLMGFPVIQAPEEADSQLAHMQKTHLLDAVMTEDMDLLPFGCEVLVRSGTKRGELNRIDYRKIREQMGLTHEQFIELCILLGTDYNTNLEGMGPKRSFEALKKHGSIETILEKEERAPDNEIFAYTTIREYYLNPLVKPMTQNDVKIIAPKLDMLQSLLIDKYNYTRVNVQRIVKVIERFHIGRISIS